MNTEGDILSLVERFCSHRRLADGTRISLMPNLPAALRLLALRGPDPRWRLINARGDRADLAAPCGPTEGAGIDRILLRAAARLELRGSRADLPKWCLSPTVTTAAHFARFSNAIRAAHDLGLGWLIPVHREVLAVLRPEVSVEQNLPHDDSGRMAVRWADGTGMYFLRGVHFDTELYHRLVGLRLTIKRVAEIPDADQRCVALTYLPVSRLLTESGAQLIDEGLRGTRLYRLPLPARIARDRPDGYGPFDYVIHMRDASHPEREFVEWVDPEIGQLGDAELCQAHAFGITREEWMSILVEG